MKLKDIFREIQTKSHKIGDIIRVSGDNINNSLSHLPCLYKIVGFKRDESGYNFWRTIPYEENGSLFRPDNHDYEEAFLTSNVFHAKEADYEHLKFEGSECQKV